MNCQRCGCEMPKIAVELTQNVFTCPACRAAATFSPIQDLIDKTFYPHSANAKAKSMRAALLKEYEKEEREKQP